MTTQKRESGPERKMWSCSSGHRLSRTRGNIGKHISKWAHAPVSWKFAVEDEWQALGKVYSQMTGLQYAVTSDEHISWCSTSQISISTAPSCRCKCSPWMALRYDRQHSCSVSHKSYYDCFVSFYGWIVYIYILLVCMHYFLYLLIYWCILRLPVPSG